MTEKRMDKGIFFTLAIVLLMIPLIFLASFYLMSTETKIDDTTSRIRCDELHYFVEDVKRDLSRAVSIFGRRAAIYAIDHVVNSSTPMMNYTFNCTSMCNVDCEKIIYPRTGSEAAIAELALCGTLNGTNVTYMVNHTVREWINRIEMRGADKNMRINITLKEIKVLPIDAWNFSIVLDNDIKVIDDTNICYYMGLHRATESNTSIIGLEDPLYTLGTSGRIIKYIDNCEIRFNQSELIKTGTGNGTSAGSAILDDTASAGNASTYCTDHPGTVGDMILVLDNGYANCTKYETDCFNNASPIHYAGVIDYGSFGQKFETPTRCNISIPYARDTSDLNLSDGECIKLSSGTVLTGINYDVVDYSCYQVSNISAYPTNCSSNYSDGPSFFDRLDGRYNLSERYSNQSREYYNNPSIGIETLIDYSDLIDHNIIPYENTSTIDYLYWQNVNGHSLCGYCKGPYPSIKLDCPHETRFNQSAGC
ncbi:MAG: hypothetical protein WAX07_09065 [Candidatus Altiarchaeia archaeon]